MEDNLFQNKSDSPSEEASSQGLDPLSACQQEVAEIKNKYLYLSAEFDNYKKRITKEQAVWTEYAQDQSLLDLIAVMIDFERAFAELEAQSLPAEAGSHFKGFGLILKNLENLLKKYGIEEIQTTTLFDPEHFEAVMQQESPSHASGEIVSILQKGYRRNNRVLLPAKVIVSK